jgi:hypothetical protein
LVPASAFYRCLWKKREKIKIKKACRFIKKKKKKKKIYIFLGKQKLTRVGV